MKSLLPASLQSAWDVQDTVTRRARLCELAFAGWKIPRCGEFSDMRRLGGPLVVYTDERAHCGDGKTLWSPGDEAPWPKSTFCSEYLTPKPYMRGRSLRRLVVGRLLFEIDYASDASWMSNVDGSYSVRGRAWDANRASDLLRYPMYAIDLVGGGLQNADGEWEEFAVDLNVCPGVPLEVVNMVGRETLAESVSSFCHERGYLR